MQHKSMRRYPIYSNGPDVPCRKGWSASERWLAVMEEHHLWEMVGKCVVGLVVALVKGGNKL